MILQSLTTVVIKDVDIAYIPMDKHSKSITRSWEQNCCYGRFYSDWVTSFQSLQHTLDGIQTQAEFTVTIMENEILQILFQTLKDMHGIMEKSSWNIEKDLLVLLIRDIYTILAPQDFSWVITWAQVWEYPTPYVTEVVAQNFLQLSEVLVIQVRALTRNGKKYFRFKVRINITTPLRIFMFLLTTKGASVRGF